MRDDRRPALLALLLLIVACVGIYGAPKAHAAVTRTEVEGCTLGSGWAVETAVAGYSGTGYARGTTTTGITCNVTVASGGGSAVIGLRGGTAVIDYEYRIDAGAWVDANTAALGSSAWVTVPASPFALTPGAHTIEVRQGSGTATAARIDYVEVTDSVATTTTTEAPTTSTTAAPTTTTTAAPTTTTTTEPEEEAAPVCIVNGDGACSDPVQVVLFNNNAMAGFFIVVAAMAGVIFAAHTLRDPGRLDA